MLSVALVEDGSVHVSEGDDEEEESEEDEEELDDEDMSEVGEVGRFSFSALVSSIAIPEGLPYSCRRVFRGGTSCHDL